MARVQRRGYWASRDGRAKSDRSHPDDEQHRLELGETLRAAWKAYGMHGRHRSFEVVGTRDWKASSLQMWADRAHIRVRFEFDGLDVPPELKEGPEGESFDEQRARAKAMIKSVREAQGVTGLEMDRRLDQQYCVYHQWEKRLSDFQLAAMQRAARALGGVFRVELEHRHNPGLLRRINRKR